MSKIIEALTGLYKAGKALLSGTVNVLKPSVQIEAVGGRRVWLSIVITLVSMVFVVVSRKMGIANEIVLAVLAVAGVTGGSFVVGESIADNTRAK